MKFKNIDAAAAASSRSDQERSRMSINAALQTPRSSNVTQAGSELTPRRVLTLLIYSAVVWYGVVQYVRYGGAAGDFTGRKAISTYLATFQWTVDKVLQTSREYRQAAASHDSSVTPSSVNRSVPAGGGIA